jgi:hypothetical protein
MCTAEDVFSAASGPEVAIGRRGAVRIFAPIRLGWRQGFGCCGSTSFW